VERFESGVPLLNSLVSSPFFRCPRIEEAIAQLLTQLDEKGNGNQSGTSTNWNEILKPSYESILRCCGSRLKVTKRDFESSRGEAYATHGHYSSASQAYSMQPYVSQFLAILRRTIALDLHDAALDLVNTALPDPNDTGFALTTTLPEGMIIFVGKLAEVITQTHNQRLETRVVSFMKATLQKAADCLIRRRPKGAQNWARNPTTWPCAE
jgi:hypothetical protein